MDDREKTAHERLIESSRQACRDAQELIAYARQARERAHATVRRLHGTAAPRDDSAAPASS